MRNLWCDVHVYTSDPSCIDALFSFRVLLRDGIIVEHINYYCFCILALMELAFEEALKFFVVAHMKIFGEGFRFVTQPQYRVRLWLS